MIASRQFSALIGGALLASALSGCSALGVTPVDKPTSSQGQGASEVDTNTIYNAVIATDPRVKDPSASVISSGVAKMLNLVVLVDGEAPVTTATLTSILIAARDSTPASIESISLVAREAADEERIVDLRDAIAGLPAGVTALWDGGVTVSRVDLEKL